MMNLGFGMEDTVLISQKNKNLSLYRLIMIREKTRIAAMWNKLHRKWELFFVFYEKNYLKVAVNYQNWVVPGSSFNVQDYNIGTEVRVPYKKIFNFLKKWAIVSYILKNSVLWARLKTIGYAWIIAGRVWGELKL